MTRVQSIALLRAAAFSLGPQALAAVCLLAAACSSAGSGSGSDAAVTDGGAGDGGDCPPLSVRPNVLSEHVAAVDETSATVIVYGGSTAVPENCDFPDPNFIADVWLFDTACAVWRKPSAGAASKGPGARGRALGAWDGTSRRLFVFGGRFRDSGTSYTLFSDLWAFDMANEQWVQIDDGEGIAPEARCAGALAYDATNDALWLFGGDASESGSAYQALDDTWRFDFGDDGNQGEWTDVSAALAPPARLLVAYAWDAAGQRLLVFGGADETAFSVGAEYLADLWALDVSQADSPAWQELDDGNDGPTGRFFSAMVFDAAASRVVLFGGHDAESLGNRNDLWTWSDDDLWQQVETGDTFANDPTGFCEFPVDFADVNLQSPERRSAHGFAASSASAWIYGGKTDCGASDDVWRLDLAELTFEEVLSARQGEVCQRFREDDPSQCSLLCF